MESKATSKEMCKLALLSLVIRRKNGEVTQVPMVRRFDAADEVSVYEAGGVLQRPAHKFLAKSALAQAHKAQAAIKSEVNP